MSIPDGTDFGGALHAGTARSRVVRSIRMAERSDIVCGTWSALQEAAQELKVFVLVLCDRFQDHANAETQRCENPGACRQDRQRHVVHVTIFDIIPDGKKSSNGSEDTKQSA